MTEDSVVNISDTVIMDSTISVGNTTCPSCDAANVRVMKCQANECDSQFCEICHPNARFNDADITIHKFDTGMGSGPFCSSCLNEMWKNAIQRKEEEDTRWAYEKARIDEEEARVAAEKARVAVEADVRWAEEENKAAESRREKEIQELERLLTEKSTISRQRFVNYLKIVGISFIMLMLADIVTSHHVLVALPTVLFALYFVFYPFWIFLDRQTGSGAIRKAILDLKSER